MNANDLSVLVACRIESVTDMAGRIGIFPFDRFGASGVSLNVSAEFRAKSETDVKTPRESTSRRTRPNQIST